MSSASTVRTKIRIVKDKIGYFLSFLNNTSHVQIIKQLLWYPEHTEKICCQLTFKYYHYYQNMYKISDSKTFITKFYSNCPRFSDFVVCSFSLLSPSCNCSVSSPSLLFLPFLTSKYSVFHLFLCYALFLLPFFFFLKFPSSSISSFLSVTPPLSLPCVLLHPQVPFIFHFILPSFLSLFLLLLVFYRNDIIHWESLPGTYVR